MKVIFLDIDGVLNTFATRKARGVAYFSDLVDRDKLVHLKKMIDATGAQIVLSSSWRKYWAEGAPQHDCACISIADALQEYGMRVSSITPVSENGQRSDEIEAWLAERRYVDAFVILDDKDHRWSKGLRARFVQTEGMEEGLNDALADVAIRVLNGELLTAAEEPKEQRIKALLKQIAHFFKK